MKKKKILFLIHNLKIGGAQRSLIELVNSMDPNRFDITIATIYNKLDLKGKIKDNVKIKSIIKTRNKFLERTFTYLVRKIVSPNWIYKRYLDDDYDYAVAFLEGLCTFLVSGCKNRKTKKIAWVHTDFRTLFCSNNVYKSLNHHKETYLTFDKIVCVSNAVQKGLCEKFSSDFDGKVVVCYNVIDDERIILESNQECNYSFNSSVLNFICIGNMRVEKAYPRLLKVAKQLVLSGRHFHITIIGAGSEYQKVKELLSNYNLEEYVSLLGNQENPYKFLKHADVFLQVSYAEGLSMTLIESIILEIPAIVTDCFGMREVLDNGKYGKIIENSEEALFDILSNVIDNPEIMDKYRSIVGERKEFFNKNKLTQAICELFN
ncbi:MAG: glycosyltransferase [Clostridia bacterium]|nr:glycosyltransferase [Clostridia bacterium]